MLQNLKIYPTIPVSDMDRAKQFYKDKLGLNGEESAEGITFKCGEGTSFFLFKSAGAGQSSSTWAGWETNDIESEVSELKGRGIVFEEYDTPNLKTVNGVATMKDNSKAAWFKDSEGNTLGIIQHE